MVCLSFYPLYEGYYSAHHLQQTWLLWTIGYSGQKLISQTKHIKSNTFFIGYNRQKPWFRLTFSGDFNDITIGLQRGKGRMAGIKTRPGNTRGFISDKIIIQGRETILELTPRAPLLGWPGACQRWPCTPHPSHRSQGAGDRAKCRRASGLSHPGLLPRKPLGRNWSCLVHEGG